MQKRSTTVVFAMLLFAAIITSCKTSADWIEVSTVYFTDRDLQNLSDEVIGFTDSIFLVEKKLITEPGQFWGYGFEYKIQELLHVNVVKFDSIGNVLEFARIDRNGVLLQNQSYDSYYIPIAPKKRFTWNTPDSLYKPARTLGPLIKKFPRKQYKVFYDVYAPGGNLIHEWYGEESYSLHQYDTSSRLVEEVYYVEHERYDINRYSYDHFGNLISETRVELRDSSNDYQYDSISVHNDLEYDDKGHWIKRTQFQQETVIADGERIDQESYYPLITKRYLIYQKGED